LGSSGTNEAQQTNKEKLRKNSEWTVLGSGGDEVKLAVLSSLNEEHYSDWLRTIKDNAQVIELEAIGIWTLISDKEKAKTLMNAYKEETVFTPLRAVFKVDKRKKVYFLNDERYYVYDIDKGVTNEEGLIRERWPMLPEVGFERVVRHS
jgi:hypothetical protein